jgi:type I restriction enzyme M protein
MSVTSPQIVQKLWSYCNVLRDDGMSYGLHIKFEPVLTYGITA